jgi:2-C-methyl-D-erythritol 2,4-cyclodiphosphate synthase
VEKSPRSCCGFGWGYDIHRLTPGYSLVLGGVTFPDCGSGFNTHSDGDVVAHAVIDALCGAIADGSLGQYFPEDAPEDQDARSIEFLGRFLPVLGRHRAEIQNLDCTVFARDAKIAPVADEMRRNIADQLRISVTAVSVKGKNKDGFSPEGTGEAASATVVAVVSIPDDAAGGD